MSYLSLILTIFLPLALPHTGAAQSSSRDSTRVTLIEAIERARRDHPLLVAAKQRVAMREAERLEAGLRPNPTLTISGENFPLDAPQGGFGVTRTLDWFATLSHTLETSGKRALRLNLADRTLEAAQAEADAVERQIVYEVKAAYQRAVIARERVALVRTSLESLGQLVLLNEVRVSAGYTAEGDLIKARLEAQRFEIQLHRMTLEYERSRIGLLRVMGGSSFDLKDTALDLVDQLEYQKIVLNPPSLTEAAMRQPVIRNAEAKVESATALLQLERARSKPDILLTGGYKRNGPDNALYGAVSIPLPLYSQNRGQIARAEAELRSSEAELRHVRSGVMAELASARRAVELGQHQLETMRANFLRSADESERISLAAYREGAVDLLVLIDAQRSRAQVQDLWLEGLYEYQLAVHELERVAAIEHLSGQVANRPTKRGGR